MSGAFCYRPGGVYWASGSVCLGDVGLGRRNTPLLSGRRNRLPPMANAPPLIHKIRKGCCGMALNDREKLFVEYFIKLGEAYPAALQAGYKESTALNASKWINPEILKNPNEKERKKYKPEVRAAIDARMAEKESELIADQDEVLKYLTAVMRKKTKSSVLARTESGAEVIIEKPPDEKESLRAAELLGKRYGLYTDRIEQEVDMDLQIVVDYGDEE